MQINQAWLTGEEVSLVVNSIKQFGGTARFVGGCVRDSILSKEIQDIDLATDLLPEQVIKALSLNKIKVIPTGIKHGTVTSIIGDKSYEITTLRSDKKCDGRHAEIEFTDNWQVDASRRDFTFNAIYCDQLGNTYDFFSGLEDLQQRKLKFIGCPEERIKEDYLRILRAFRFHASICIGELDAKILLACQKHSEMINRLSGERIKSEFFKIVACENPVLTFITMRKYNIIQKFMPYNVSYDILSSIALRNTTPLVKLAALLRTIGTNNTNCNVNQIEPYNQIADRLCFSNQEKKNLQTLVNNTMLLPLPISEQKKNIRLLGKNSYCDMIKILHSETGASSEQLEQYILFANNFIIPQFPLSGLDLQKIGYKPGKFLGKSLELIKNYWESNSYEQNKSELLLYAQNLLDNSNK